jgi:short subunit dehydrogenase-like uncharacterized protein
MADFDWVLYGATGYTGKLLAEEAVRRGHRPLLAGRSAKKLEPLAETLGLEWIAVHLYENIMLTELAGRSRVVFLAAGPYTFTSRPMIEACLEAGAHYLDITGEIPVFKQTFSFHENAIQRGVALISGAGFDAIPTDCLAKYVADRLPEAEWLETAYATAGAGISAGTFKSSLEMLPNGILARREGVLVPADTSATKRIRFIDRERTAVPTSWGDLETAYHSTGIPNISTYMGIPSRYIPAYRLFTAVVPPLASLRPVRRLLQFTGESFLKGPSEEIRRKGRTQIWARASTSSGQEVEAWLETLEAYAFTAKAGVRCVEKVLSEQPVGALSPAEAFGADFALEIEYTRRLDQLS